MARESTSYSTEESSITFRSTGCVGIARLTLVLGVGVGARAGRGGCAAWVSALLLLLATIPLLLWRVLLLLVRGSAAVGGLLRVVATVPLRVRGVVGAVLDALLAVLEAACLWGPEGVCATGRTVALILGLRGVALVLLLRLAVAGGGGGVVGSGGVVGVGHGGVGGVHCVV